MRWIIRVGRIGEDRNTPTVVLGVIERVTHDLTPFSIAARRRPFHIPTPPVDCTANAQFPEISMTNENTCMHTVRCPCDAVHRGVTAG